MIASLPFFPYWDIGPTARGFFSLRRKVRMTATIQVPTGYFHIYFLAAFHFFFLHARAKRKRGIPKNKYENSLDASLSVMPT